MLKWINFFILALAIALCSSGCDNDSDAGSIQKKAGLKTLVVDYSPYADSNTIPDQIIPVEAGGFMTMSASSTGDVIIAGAAEGKLYYSNDGGVTWFTLEGIGAEDVWTGATVSADGQIIAVVGQSLYISTDSGDNWTIYSFEVGYDSLSHLVMSDDGLTMVKFAGHEIEISYDFGKSWISLDDEIFGEIKHRIVAVSLTADGEKIAVLKNSERLRLSYDNGLSWGEAAPDIVDLPVTQPEKGLWEDMAMTPNGNIIAFIALVDNSALYAEIPEKFEFYLSLDGGETWSKKIVEGFFLADSLAISIDGQKMIVSGGNPEDTFMFSNDFGTTWGSIPTSSKENTYSPSFTHVFSNNGNRIVSMEMEYSIWTSDDLGQTWVKRLQGLGKE